jgi:hypothetical protein
VPSWGIGRISSCVHGLSHGRHVIDSHELQNGIKKRSVSTGGLRSPRTSPARVTLIVA